MTFVATVVVARYLLVNSVTLSLCVPWHLPQMGAIRWARRADLTEFACSGFVSEPLLICEVLSGTTNKKQILLPCELAIQY